MSPSPAKNSSRISGAEAIDETFSRRNSLKSRRRIGEMFRKSRRRSGKFLTVFYDVFRLDSKDHQAGETVKPLQWLIAIPKRSGTASERKRIQRRLREIVRRWPARHQLGGELIVRYNPPGAGHAEKPNFADLREDVLEALDRIDKKISES